MLSVWKVGGQMNERKVQLTKYLRKYLQFGVTIFQQKNSVNPKYLPRNPPRFTNLSFSQTFWKNNKNAVVVRFWISFSYNLLQQVVG